MRFRQHQDAARQATTRLLLAFALVVAGLVVAVNAALALLWWLVVPFATALPNHFIATNTGLVLLYVLGGWWVETSRLSAGGAAVAQLAGARAAQPGRGQALSRLEQRYVNVVQEMALASGHAPVPAAWVLPRDDAINAFACGWKADDAVVAVTRGALERLTRAELQGVVAHEFSHLAHGDARLNLRLAGMVWGLQLIWSLGRAMMAPDVRGQRRAVFLIGLVLAGVGALGWLAGRLLQAAVSRQREFLADASAVKYTRAVDGLGGALRKLVEQEHQGRVGLVDTSGGSLEHLMFAATGRLGRWQRWLATHPPLAERVARLYGQPMEALDDRPLPPLAQDEPVHPALAALVAATQVRPTAVIGRDRPADAEALRHDAWQKPAHFDAVAREDEALTRLARWQGPGEWQVALLALGWPGPTRGDVQDDTQDSARHDVADAAWDRATAGLAVATAVQAEIATLRPAARRMALVALLEAARAWPAAARRARRTELLRSRWPAGPVNAARRWRAFVIDRALRAPSSRVVRAPVGFDARASAEAATAWLAPALGLTGAMADAWQAAACEALEPLPAPAAPRLRGLAPARPVASRALALRVRWLVPMQRPLLLRAWLQAAERTGALNHDGVRDALHLACLALELPVPETLQGRAQERIL